MPPDRRITGGHYVRGFMLPEMVHSAVLWSIFARWDELEAQKRYVPNEQTREDLKFASAVLHQAGFLRFDPLKDK